MSSLARAALFVAVVVAVGGVFFFASRTEPKPARAVRSEAPRVLDPAPQTARREPEREAPPVPPRVPRPAASVEEALATDDALAAAMHALEDSDPARALELARRGQVQWPAGPRAAEFAATEVKCLYRLGRPSEGRGAAEAMVNRYPSSPWALEVEKQTGAHPYVNH